VSAVPSERTIPNTKMREPRTQQTPNSLTPLAVLAFAVPVVAYFWFVGHYSVNVPVADQWSDINVIAHSYSGTLSLGVLWTQHNDNRILFPNLIVLLLAYTTHFNLIVEQFISALMLCAATGLFIMTHKRRSPTTPWIYYCPVALLLLSFVQYESSLWGFVLGWYLVLLSLAVVLFMLDSPALTWPILTVAIVAAVIGSYSATQGLLIWPTGLVLLYLRNRHRALVLTWIVAGVLAGAVYLWGFSTKIASLNLPWNYAVDHPVSSLKFFFYVIGDVVGIRTPSNDGVLALGVLIFLLAMTVVSEQRFRRARAGGGPVGVALICYGLLFAAITTQGRVALGMWTATGSRFTTFELLILVGTYFALLDGLTGKRVPPTSRRAVNRPLSRHYVRVVVRATLIVIICLQVALGIENGLTGARAHHASFSMKAYELVHINEYSDYTLSGGFPLGVTSGTTVATTIRQLAEVAKAHHLSLFASMASVNDAKRAFPGGYTQPVTRIVVPTEDAKLTGDQLLSATVSDEFRITKAEFQLSGEGLRGALIGVGNMKLIVVGKNTVLGFRTLWNTADIPNGIYHLRSVVYDALGKVTYSVPTDVTLAN
jgi:hypothetical protein